MKTGELGRIWWVFIVLTLMAFVSGCKQDLTSDNGPENQFDDEEESEEGGGLEGTITIDGSSTVYPFSLRAAVEFEKKYPGVKPNVGVSGTGGGFNRFANGETDISNASRPIKADELKVCQQNNIEFIELPIAYDGLTIVVNPQNDWVKQLTVKQLQHIFAEGGAKTWNEIEQGWPNEEIKINSPGTDSGTFDYFKEVVVGKDGAIRRDMETSEDDNVIVTSVAGERTAIGYFGASYYFENKEKVKAVPIVNPQTEKPEVPSPDTIRSGEYSPFSRPLFIYVSLKAVRRPEVKKFVQFQLDNAEKFSKRVNYVPLPDEIYATAQDRLKNRVTGTAYLTADGQKREGPLSEVYRAE
jgi:phosphate transport system substrate-binding protein